MIITLTSDFGLKDHYVGALKGMMYSRIPQINIVDISHQISPFVIQEAAYVVSASYYHFPPKTIHLVLVDAEISSENQPILIYWNKHYFLGANNGVLSLITHNQSPEAIINLSFEEGVSTTDFYVEVTSKIALGASIYELGQPTEALKETQHLNAAVSEDGNRITGNIIHIDHYGNAISNISKDLFMQISNGRSFEILFRSYRITKTYNSYIDYASEKHTEIGGKMAIFNSSGLLEIALYRGSSRGGGTASSLFGIEYESSISVRFIS